MHEALKDLFRMFYPLSGPEQLEWAALLAGPEAQYFSGLESKAMARGLSQVAVDSGVSWCDQDGNQLMLLFRVVDPRNLDAVRRVYDAISANAAPLAYTFVHQIADGEGTWDIFHMSKLTYLAHCNRVSGPGSQEEL